MEIAATESSLIIKTTGPLETEAVGKALGVLLGSGDVVGLSGDLGAGKTCFTRGLACGMKVDQTVPVVSPSFTILNEYPGRCVLYHFDFYRLEGFGPDFDFEWREYFYGNGVVVIEWAEKVADFLPDDRMEVTFLFLEGEGREIRLQGKGAHHVSLVAECGTRIRDMIVR